MTTPDPAAPDPAAPGPEAEHAETLRRLRWQCRRGMLELDQLLLAFLEAGYTDLDPAGRAAFSRLLTQQDQDLHGWFMTGIEPPDAELAALVRHIVTVVSEKP